MPESPVLWGSSTYRAPKGKDNMREKVEEREAPGKPDNLELRIGFIRPDLFSKSQQEDKIKTCI